MTNEKNTEKIIESEFEGVINILQLGTVLLAVVSFWATAQGMLEYVFPKEWQCYAASLAIQGILLGLNFYLPTILGRIKKNNDFTKWEKFWRKTGTIVFSVIILLLSSWFSYLYIADKAYEDSWNDKCVLLIQETYRDNLYEASDYAEQYQNELEKELSPKLLEVYNRAKNLKVNEVTASNINWDNELDAISDDNAAADQLKMVIPYMKAATVENSSKDAREQASNAIDSSKSILNQRIEQAKSDIENADINIENYEKRINEQQTLIGRAESWQNTNANVEIMNYYQDRIKDENSKKEQASENINNYENAIQKLETYIQTLNNVSRTSQINLGDNLREIQGILYSQEPDSKRISELTNNLYNGLQNSANLYSKQEDTYIELMNDVGSLIQEMNDYITLNTETSSLRALIEEIGDIETYIPNPQNNSDDTAQEQSNVEDISTDEPTQETEETTEPTDEAENPDGSEGQTTDLPESSEGQTEEETASETVSDEQNAATETLPDETADNQGDMEDQTTNSGGSNTTENQTPSEPNSTPRNENDLEMWKSRVQYLLALISRLPIYSGEDEYLSQYSKSDATKQLDKILDRYTGNHNRAEKGIIYFTNSYRWLAVFSIILALMLDVGAFITGIIIYNLGESKEKDSQTHNNNQQGNVNGNTNG